MSLCKAGFPKIMKHPFKVIAFDWDGTAVVNRKVDARPVAGPLEELMKLGVYVVIITGTNFGNIDRQFCSLITGPHKKNLYVCTDRGSEVHGFDEDGQPVLLYGREATDEENELLSKVAEAVERDIENATGLPVEIVYDRLNRRKIDLIPEWENPPKEQIGELLEKTEARLKGAGFTEGIKGAFRLAEKYSKELGLKSASITSDVKHVEVGLTDKSDSVKWIIEELVRKRNVPFRDTLVLGDEFGPIAGFQGSDFLTYYPEAPGISYVSVGKEPNGVPEGVHHVGGGPACFLQLMEAQVELYKKLRPTEDPTFLVVEEGYNPLREREIESIFTVGNGYLGTRGSLAERTPESEPATLIAGVYDQLAPGELEELVIVPDWLYTRIYVDGVQLTLAGERSIVEHRRTLDMKKGIVYREWRHRGDKGRITSIKMLQFASLADPHAMGMRITVVPENYTAEVRVETGIELCRKAGLCAEPVETRTLEDEQGALITTRTRFLDTTVTQAQLSHVAPGLVKQAYSTYIDQSGVSEDWRWQAGAGQVLEIEKFVAIHTTRETGDPVEAATAAVKEYAERGLSELLLDHIEAWEERWDIAAIKIEGDQEAQLWANFAGYHLIIAGTHLDERVSVSARTLTGTIYKGHVFWDADTFMVPFFVSTHPPTARAMLMYRYHTLPGARQEARELGARGVLYPWESTIRGDEQTPESVIAPNGEVILILSGKLEQHINVSVAHAVWLYYVATGDEEFFLEAGAEMLIETARFWLDRVEKHDTTYHILNIEGPDEYHEIVNDNLYTNMMVAWSLRRAEEAVAYLKERHPERWQDIKAKIGMQEGELAEWDDVATNIYIDAEQADDLLEQFAGFFELKDINVRDYEPRTGPLDAILGREETAATQLVKQADVVMLVYLLEHEFSEEVIKKNYLYYEQRTGHGSSLSPSIYGLVAARLGLTEMAMRYLHQAGTIDLSNNMGNAAGGVHAAALGGLWQQFIMGFAGVRVLEEGIYFFPQLPDAWERYEFSLLWHANRLDIVVELGKRILLTVGGEGDASVGIFGKPVRALSPEATYASEWDGSTWQDFTKIEQEGVA